ncbi:DUF6924 domain-containing protein [Nocardia sp. NPDC056541]|uniref:DUF6924 domain-containing protein n=1 Tax=Nocardia sp. NPDC056541 TaxID=3345860 RepID=UPI00366D7B41
MTRVIRAALTALVIVSATVGCDDGPGANVVHDNPVKRMLPEGESLLLRTDFNDDAAWRETLDAVNRFYESEDVEYGLTVIDTPDFREVTAGDLEKLLTSQYYIYIIDEQTIRDPEHPILAVDNSGGGEPAAGLPTFRILPREVGPAEVNLTLANMDFEDFASAVDADGVFRGF